MTDVQANTGPTASGLDESCTVPCAFLFLLSPEGRRGQRLPQEIPVADLADPSQLEEFLFGLLTARGYAKDWMDVHVRPNILSWPALLAGAPDFRYCAESTEEQVTTRLVAGFDIPTEPELLVPMDIRALVFDVKVPAGVAVEALSNLVFRAPMSLAQVELGGIEKSLRQTELEAGYDIIYDLLENGATGKFRCQFMRLGGGMLPGVASWALAGYASMLQALTVAHAEWLTWERITIVCRRTQRPEHVFAAVVGHDSWFDIEIPTVSGVQRISFPWDSSFHAGGDRAYEYLKNAILERRIPTPHYLVPELFP